MLAFEPHAFRYWQASACHCPSWKRSVLAVCSCCYTCGGRLYSSECVYHDQVNGHVLYGRSHLNASAIIKSVTTRRLRILLLRWAYLLLLLYLVDLLYLLSQSVAIMHSLRTACTIRQLYVVDSFAGVAYLINYLILNNLLPVITVVVPAK